MEGQSEEYRSVTELLGRYFEGLYQADSRMLAGVFHPQALYVNATPGDFVTHDMAEYFSIIEDRISPASQGEARREKIISIAFAGPELAFVHAQMRMMKRGYTDYLTLTKADGQWRVAAKAFHYDPET